MTAADTVTLYYNPPSRADGTRVLLEELGAPYEVRLLDLQAGDQLKPEFLAVNPMGKVPTIVHRGIVVTEQVAIAIYLATPSPPPAFLPRSTIRCGAPICAGWCSRAPASSRR